MTATGIAERLERKFRHPSKWREGELNELIRDVWQVHLVNEATTGARIPSAVTVVGGGASRGPRAVDALRAGLVWLLFLGVVGVSLFAVSPGFGLGLIYAGFFVFLVFAHGYGMQTGEFLIGPRYSILGMIAILGLTITALIGSIENLLRSH